MAGILDTLRSRMGHQASGGFLSGLGGAGGGGGILSTAVGPLQSRLATVQAAGSPQEKITALAGTLGMRLKTLGTGGLLSKFGAGTGTPAPGSTPPSADSFQVSGIARMYGSPTPPEGIQFR